MYRPSYTATDSYLIALQLIQEYPLGLLISHSGGEVDSNYLPFLVETEGESLMLTTHMARANPQWRNLGEVVLVSFLGPQRYISPTMYKGENNVPTWNYAAVQFQGKPELITDSQEIHKLLVSSVKKFEARNGTQWEYRIPRPLQEKLESAIIGVRIKSSGRAKLKLSQNRNDEDYESVLRFLKSSELCSDRALYDWMRRSQK